MKIRLNKPNNPIRIYTRIIFSTIILTINKIITKILVIKINILISQLLLRIRTAILILIILYSLGMVIYKKLEDSSNRQKWHVRRI